MKLETLTSDRLERCLRQVFDQSTPVRVTLAGGQPVGGELELRRGGLLLTGGPPAPVGATLALAAGTEHGRIEFFAPVVTVLSPSTYRLAPPPKLARLAHTRERDRCRPQVSWLTLYTDLGHVDAPVLDLSPRGVCVELQPDVALPRGTVSALLVGEGHERLVQLRAVRLDRGPETNRAAFRVLQGDLSCWTRQAA